MAFTTSNDINILQSADSTNVGAGAGDDRYVLDASLLTAGQRITISDTEGSNTLLLTGGLVITSSSVSNSTTNALQLTLSNGAVITVLGASSFNFQTGGALNGTGGTIQNYSTFVTSSLGVAGGVPAAGAASATGSTVTVNPSGGTGPITPVGPTFSVTGSTAAAEGASATFTVTLSAAQSSASTVTYTLAGTGGTTLGTDTGTNVPAGNTGTLTFAAGEVTKTIVVPIMADAISPEAGEGVSITLSAPSTGIVLSTTAATVTTAITDVPLTYTLTASSASVFEGVGITYTLTASAPSTTATTINFSVVPGDAAAANQGTSNTNLNDFAAGAFNPATVVLAAGATTATYIVTSANDTITELPENYSVRAVIGTTTVATSTTSLLDGAGANVGTTFTLTTGTDSGSAFTGSANNDTFNAGALASNGTTAAITLNALDVINGGDGIDTLVLDTTGDQNSTVLGTITNVENLTFVGTGTTLTTYAATPFSGAIRFQQTADTSVEVTAVTGQTLVLDRVADATALTGKYAPTQASATLQAAAILGDATFSISGTGLKTANLSIDRTLTGKSVTVTDTSNTTEAANITASGANTVTVESTALKSVTVSGAGAVSLTTTTAPTTSVDASANTGGLTLVTALATGASFTGGTGKDTVTVGASTKAIVMGDGDDTVTWTAAALAAGGSANGGVGVDTITLTAANAATATSTLALGAAFAASVSNFEKFGIGATGNTATVIDAGRIAGITYITSVGTGAGTGTLTVNNMAANSTFESTAFQDAATALNLKDTTGVADVINIRFAATNGFLNAGVITIAGVETLNVTTLDTDTTAPTQAFTAPITATSVKSVVVAGNVGINLTGLTATTLTSFDASGVTATAGAGAVTLTTGAVTDNLVMKGGAGNDVLNANAAATATKTVNIDGGAGNDTITGSATLTNTLTGGIGNDTINGGSGVDTINGGAGNDTINSGAGLDAVNVNVGDDTYVVTANANGNIYASITGMGAGDKIDFLAGGGAAPFVTAAITLAPTAAFADFLQAAAAGTAAAGRVVHFQFAGNTYLVHDVDTGATFVNGIDQVVQLVGLVNLTTATIDGAATNILTLA